MAKKGREIILTLVQNYLGALIYPTLRGFCCFEIYGTLHTVPTQFIETVVIVKIDKGLARMLAKLALDLHLFTLDCKGLRFSE
jgi:hypothetical protein